jgi:NhaP-type Na+/H+ or K+/H+ antiporter
MSQTVTRAEKKQANWKSQVYVIGAIAGTLVGFVASYLYARAIEEDVNRNGAGPQMQTGDMIALGLALLSVVRQIAEMGNRASGKK